MNKKERTIERKKVYEERVEKFKDTILSDKVCTHYLTEVDLSKITEPDYMFIDDIGITITKNTTVGYLKECYNNKTFVTNDKIAILNFASFYNPGGGFLKGSSAQEEELCENSLLFYYLEKYKDIYKKRDKELVYSGYNGDIILAKSVPFFLDSHHPKSLFSLFDVISCSAPNYSVMKKECKTATDHAKLIMKIYQIYRQRIYNILNLARKEQITHLILGAWGCGVFGNNPSTVASIFKEVIEENQFDQWFKCIFVIPDNETLESFKNNI